MASQPLRTGNEGVETLVCIWQRPEKRPARPPRKQRRERKSAARVLTDQRECWCVNCRRQGGIVYPRYYVRMMPLWVEDRRYLQALRELAERAARLRAKQSGKDGEVYISFECFMEQQAADPDLPEFEGLEEEMERLRNDPPRRGSAIVDRHGEFE